MSSEYHNKNTNCDTVIYQQPRPGPPLPKGESYLTIGWKQVSPASAHSVSFLLMHIHIIADLDCIEAIQKTTLYVHLPFRFFFARGCKFPHCVTIVSLFQRNVLGFQHNWHACIDLPERQVHILISAEYLLGPGAGNHIHHQVCVLIMLNRKPVDDRRLCMLRCQSTSARSDFGTSNVTGRSLPRIWYFISPQVLRRHPHNLTISLL